MSPEARRLYRRNCQVVFQDSFSSLNPRQLVKDVVGRPLRVHNEASGQELTEQAGLPAYEVSNHAAPGHQCRHNLTYWRSGEYAGAGPGAHSRLDGDGGRRIGLASERHPEQWRAGVEARGQAIVEEIVLQPSEQGEEYLLMGLRLGEGIELERYARLAGQPLDPARIERLVAGGFLARSPDGSRIAATPAGRRVLNALIAELAV